MVGTSLEETKAISFLELHGLQMVVFYEGRITTEPLNFVPYNRDGPWLGLAIGWQSIAERSCDVQLTENLLRPCHANLAMKIHFAHVLCELVEKLIVQH